MSRQHDSRLQKLWYSRGYLHLLLAPLSALFAAVSGARRALFRHGWLTSHRVEAPVIVVGNITVGGTGKTPVAIWLAEQLRARGLRPGIVSRGYGGVIGDVPMQANASSDPAIVGDEPLLMAIRSQCPVVVHPDRVAAARELVDMGIDVVISDDGLQHYRLQRDFEIAVVDGARGLGNGWRLPAGPLREAAVRLEAVDRVLVQVAGRDVAATASIAAADDHTTRFHLVAHELVSVSGAESRSFAEQQDRPVHAIAAIGNPERFFAALESQGLTVMRHPMPDHAALSPRDLAFDDDADIVMTEKDAVKCREFATSRCWYVPVDVDMHDERWFDDLVEQISRPGSKSADD